MLKGSKTQITIAQRYQPSTKSQSSSSSNNNRNKSESHELQGLGGIKNNMTLNSPETIVDDMVYRSTARIIATIDISYSTLMVVVQLLGLIMGAGAHGGKDKSFSSTTTPTPNGTINHQFNNYSSTIEQPALSRKIRETIAVLVWTGLFTVCIVQLVVAGALYGGTNERDGRKCIRNCRIWCMTTIFLVVLIICQIIGVFIVFHPRKHIWFIIILFIEFSCRLIGLFFIKKFIKELVFEYCDDDDNDRGENMEVQYEQLIPSPIPILKNGHYSV